MGFVIHHEQGISENIDQVNQIITERSELCPEQGITP